MAMDYGIHRPYKENTITVDDPWKEGASYTCRHEFFMMTLANPKQIATFASSSYISAPAVV